MVRNLGIAVLDRHFEILAETLPPTTKYSQFDF